MRRPTRGLNLLGCALIVEMILNPAVSKRLGFQLSYLSTASILLFVPKITIQDPTDLTLFQKMIYLISLYTQKAFSIALSLSLVSAAQSDLQFILPFLGEPGALSLAFYVDLTRFSTLGERLFFFFD